MLTYKNRNIDVAVLFVARLLPVRYWTDERTAPTLQASRF